MMIIDEKRKNKKMMFQCDFINAQDKELKEIDLLRFAKSEFEAVRILASLHVNATVKIIRTANVEKILKRKGHKLNQEAVLKKATEVAKRTGIDFQSLLLY